MKTYGNKIRSITPKPMKKYSTSINPSRKKLLIDWVQFTVPKSNGPVEDLIKTGLIPYKILQSYISNFSLKGFHLTPNSSQAYNNILLLNNFIYRDFPNSELPSPSEILKKASNDCWVLINTLFKNYCLYEMRNIWGKCFEWYKSILKLYNIEVTKQSFTKESQNGVNLACILNCYTGFKLSLISKFPTPNESLENIQQVFNNLKGKIFLPLEAHEFYKTSDEDLINLTLFAVFKIFRHEVPSLPTREKIHFKEKHQLLLNTTESLVSLSSMESLEYSKSTIMSKEPSEAQLPIYKTPKWNKEKNLDVITNDSTGYSIQPYEVSYESVSVANTSYTKKTSEKLQNLERVNALCERKYMFIADIRGKKERLQEVPSLKKLRPINKKPEDNLIGFLITPRLLKMIKPSIENLLFTVVIDAENFTSKNESYFFEWKDFSLSVKGKINVNEINFCESVGRLLNIRTFYDEMTIQCIDEKEACMYVKGLKKLCKPRTLFSRDISCNELISKIR
ncbi:hypothetical protein SteCoe_25517 [Stentor coeruleus]|uniref:Uncharacterized protein n=1 Tax=Stentor coeruleus TaxID=5963 RepID=A0A1R2BF35_9CILI|nr:hypothetical protein SteCoe_25517 [Stentor coeruleus]